LPPYHTGIPGDIIVSPDSKTVYVTNNDTNTVQFIDTATNTVTFTISVGNLPFGLAISPDVGESATCVAIAPNGNYAYVADILVDAVLVVDITPQ
jgi:YVTN family beta-propeller protein